MAKVLVLYYVTYGHVEIMAGAVAEGARTVGAEVHVKRVLEKIAAPTTSSSIRPRRSPT